MGSPYLRLARPQVQPQIGQIGLQRLELGLEIGEACLRFPTLLEKLIEFGGQAGVLRSQVFLFTLNGLDLQRSLIHTQARLALFPRRVIRRLAQFPQPVAQLRQCLRQRVVATLRLFHVLLG